MNVLIVDDEFMPAEHLAGMIARHCPQISERVIYHDPLEALRFLKNNSPDLIFLDIEMPGVNAFEFIEIVGLENMPPIIFTTAYSSYAVQAFKVQAVDYLLKPVDAEDLVAAVNRVRDFNRGDQKQKLTQVLEDRPSEEKDRIVLAEGQYYHFVQMKEIIHVAGSGSYCTFFLSDGRKVMTSKHLKFYSDRLIKLGFVRTHQSHVVNVDYIKGFNKADGGELILQESHRVPISTRLKNDVLQSLGLS